MHVRVLETWSYPNGAMRSEKVSSPTLEQVEASVRRLDRRVHPILFLWASDDPALHMIDESSERLEVLGGAGLYWVAGTFDGRFQRRFLDPAGGGREVPFWGFEIEHGFAAAERNVCRNVELVVQAARHYAEFGRFDPSLPWE